MKIFKYTLDPSQHEILIPIGAKFLSVQAQYNEPQMWFLVDPKAAKESRHFIILPTGGEYQGGFYLGTFQLNGGALVFHLFETTK